MTFPDPSLERPLERPGGNPDNLQDIVPPTERGMDPQRDSVEHGLTREGSRPLTDEEKKAADRDAPAGERVYAPASERVPVDPVPGHRDFVEHLDTHTPEREAAAGQVTSPSAAWSSPPSPPSPSSGEPSFTRVSRPNPSTTATPGAYASPMSNPGFDYDEFGSRQHGNRRRKMFFGLGFSWATVICTGVGVWLFMRWRRERNKPINRLRRQAQHAAAELRERIPDPEEAARPAMGLTTALVSLLVVLWKQSQARSQGADKVMRRQAGRASHRADKVASKATDLVSDIDWHKRLTQLKERWSPGRLELEKTSISRH